MARNPGRHRCCKLFASLGLWLLSGCATDPGLPIRPGEPIAVQMRRAEDQLNARAYRVLLDFEAQHDAALVSSPEAHVDPRAAHTGRQSLRLRPGSSFEARLCNILPGRPFPANWTLIGAFLYSDRPARLTLSLTDAPRPLQRQLEIPANQWTPVLLDVSELPSRTIESEADGAVTLSIDAPAGARMWLDDLIVVDNTKVLVPSAASPEPDVPWTITRRGHQVTFAHPLFRYNVQLAQRTVGGWKLEEANAVRARFSSSGKESTLVLYSDGRELRDGKLTAVGRGALPDLVAPHESPAEIEVPEPLGQVVRDTPGDQNNDGYNEVLGAYQVQASGPRLEVRLHPTRHLVAPILEIRGLAKGQVLATLQGQLLPRVTRTSSGNVLIPVPGSFDKPFTIDIAVR